MSKIIEAVATLTEAFPLVYVEDYTDHVWSIGKGEVSWVDDNEVYSVECREGSLNDLTSSNGVVCVNGDNGCGETLSYMFSLNNHTDEDLEDV